MKMFVAAHRATFQQFMKFGTVGTLGFFVDTALVYFGIYAFDFSRVMAGLVSFPFTVSFTWIGNRIFTFRASPKTRMGSQWVKFLMVCAVGLVFNRGTYSLLVMTVPFVYAHPVIGLMAGTGVAMFFNFFLSRRLVFR